jgi:hypothetical protein
MRTAAAIAAATVEFVSVAGFIATIIVGFALAGGHVPI